MTDQEYNFLCEALRDRCGVSLEQNKQYLMEARLGPVVRKLGLESIGEFVVKLRTQPGDAFIIQLVEALVTTETSFFRDHHPWEALRKTILPKLLHARRSDRRLNIWCAASAAGQEPYSVALLLREHFPELGSWKVTLIASDVSREMLAKAKEGKYNQIEVNRGLPAALLVKYFAQRGAQWQLHEDVRRMVDFREVNLHKTWPTLPHFDLIMIRNVMIYFEPDVKKSILGKIARLLNKDGFLLLGAAETTIYLDASYQRVPDLKAGFYFLSGG